MASIQSTGPQHLLFPLHHRISDASGGDASTRGAVKATDSTAESGGSNGKAGGSQGLREGEEGEGDACVGVAGMHERQLRVRQGEVAILRERVKVRCVTLPQCGS